MNEDTQQHHEAMSSTPRVASLVLKQSSAGIAEISGTNISPWVPWLPPSSSALSPPLLSSQTSSSSHCRLPPSRFSFAVYFSYLFISLLSVKIGLVAISFAPNAAFQSTLQTPLPWGEILLP